MIMRVQGSEYQAAPPDGAGRDCSVPLGRANLLSLIFGLPSALLLLFLYALRWNLKDVRSSFSHLPGGMYTFLGLCLAFVLLHEIIHGLAWMVIGRRSRGEVSFGFHLKTLTPFAHVNGRLDVNVYRWGTALPGLVLGIFPSLAGIFGGNAVVMALGVVFTAAAGGDFLILWLLRKAEAGSTVEDHPTNAGCTVYEQGPDSLRDDRFSGENPGSS